VNIDLLKRLCETPGIPGREERVRELVLKEVKGLFDEVETDPMGSLICRRRPRPRKGGKKATSKRGSSNGSRNGHATKVMLLAHMDEIGFYVSHVDSKGWIWLNPAGGFDGACDPAP